MSSERKPALKKGQKVLVHTTYSCAPSTTYPGEVSGRRGAALFVSVADGRLVRVSAVTWKSQGGNVGLSLPPEETK